MTLSHRDDVAFVVDEQLSCGHCKSCKTINRSLSLAMATTATAIPIIIIIDAITIINNNNNHLHQKYSIHGASINL